MCGGITSANRHLQTRRYFTEELKDFEDKVLNAEGLRSSLESELFDALRLEVGTYVTRIASTAAALADLDALAALAEVAHQHNYCRPTIDDGDIIEVIDARHPVVEQAVGREDFVPNSIRLDRDEQSLIILTGPNMAGKSTVMRKLPWSRLWLRWAVSYPPRRQRWASSIESLPSWSC